MKQTFEHIILKTELTQSQVFGEQYQELLSYSESTAFNNPVIEDVAELLNHIIVKYELLTDFQKGILIRLFDEFNNIRINIDPKRLKSFYHYYNEDQELLMYRETTSGLINIIINPEECLAFSFIPNNEQQRQFYFVHPDEDFERLAYDFFSH